MQGLSGLCTRDQPSSQVAAMRWFGKGKQAVMQYPIFHPGQLSSVWVGDVDSEKIGSGNSNTGMKHLPNKIDTQSRIVLPRMRESYGGASYRNRRISHAHRLPRFCRPISRASSRATKSFAIRPISSLTSPVRENCAKGPRNR